MFEWDEEKRRINQAKHGVDFAEIARFDWDSSIVSQDPRHDEPRFQAIGYIGVRLHVVVYTPRGQNRRIISLRKANRREANRYAKT